MLKEALRKEFFKLKLKGLSYSKCRSILKAQHFIEVSLRTLKRWTKRLDSGDWDFRDVSKRPKTIHYKITPQIEKEVIELRNKTGWSQEKLYPFLKHLGISEMSIKRIIKRNKLCRATKTRGKRIKWIKFQREHPNILWQMDFTDEQDLFNCYTLAVVDDCSRYLLCAVKLDHVTTENVIEVLKQLIAVHGKPREILTDNGSAFGLTSKDSHFDKWCKKKGIKHIRTKIHSPTTNGKVERIFKTMDEELSFCNNDLEMFRYRYNHYRPHSSLGGITPAERYFSW